MARAHVMRPITGSNGDLLYGARVTVREAGLSVPVAQTLYAGPTGTATLPNPHAAAQGVIDFWVERPQRVSVLVQADGHSDILVYLDATVPPEETVRTDAPLVITGEQVPGHVLLAGDTPGQAVWGEVPAATGVTPLVTVVDEEFEQGADPAGWTFVQAASTARDYDDAVPEEQGFTRSLHVEHTAASGSLVLTSPSFTLQEPGYVALWMRPNLAAGEQVSVSVTSQEGAQTSLVTVTGSREWGFYRYPLAAGTYQRLTVQVTGDSDFTGSGHEVWLTGIRAVYGGQVPAHTHPGTGAGSVMLGTGAAADGVGAVAIGSGAKAYQSGGVAVGSGAEATVGDGVAVGSGAKAVAADSVAVGAGAAGNLAATGWTAIGDTAYVDAADGLAVGKGAQVYSSSGVAIGVGAYVGASAADGVAIGKGARSEAPQGLALGANAQVGAGNNGSVALGRGTVVTGASQVMLGAPNAFTATIVQGRLYAVGHVNLGTDATSRLGFFGAEGTTRPVVTGSDGGVIALRNLLAALHGLGLIVNNTTA